jgi:hypothetical protein
MLKAIWDFLVAFFYAAGLVGFVVLAAYGMGCILVRG